MLVERGVLSWSVGMKSSSNRNQASGVGEEDNEDVADTRSSSDPDSI